MTMGGRRVCDAVGIRLGEPVRIGMSTGRGDDVRELDGNGTTVKLIGTNDCDAAGEADIADVVDGDSDDDGDRGDV
jgi:hypothetical protein